jgi:hypothetical protein
VGWGGRETGEAVLGFELRADILSHSTSLFFMKVFFEIGSLELFAQADFQLLSLARITGMSYRCPAKIDLLLRK